VTASATATTVDCRGQRCPAPILATAKAARTLGGSGGGILEISADDDAFPLDIRSWCRSSGSELVQLHSEGMVHTAVVRVGGRANGPLRIAPPPLRSAAVPVRLTEPSPSSPSPAASSAVAIDRPAVLDCRGQLCPGPILGLARRARALGAGATLEVLADDPAFELDLKSWCRSTRAQLLSIELEGTTLRARIQLAGEDRAATTAREATAREATVESPVPAVAAPAGEPVSLLGVAPADRIPRLAALLTQRPGGATVTVLADDPGFSIELLQWASAAGHRLLSLDARGPLQAQLELAAPTPSVALVVQDGTTLLRDEAEPQCTLLVLHNDREALLAALLVAVGAAAQGMRVMMFFTFWGLNLLRGDGPNLAMPREKVSWAQRMFKWMMPKGPAKQKLGKLDMAGIGRGMLGSIMKRYELMDIPQLMATAEEQGVRFVACTMSMQVMGITKRDLSPRANLDYGGVAAFVESAARSRMSLTF
jgi:TusA-related sulfurtransferase/peroxiredoxin family protein